MTIAAQTPTDPNALKTAIRRQWDACAPGWNDKSAVIRTWLRDSTDAMMAMTGIDTGARVLDVAAGAGDQTLDIARRVGPDGHVLATDLSPAILKFAEDNARRAGLDNVSARVADGEALPVADAGFDVAVCRLGLMFFPDPGAGLQQMFRALKPGGKACTLVFSAPEHNPCIGILMSTACKHAGLPPPSPHQPGGLMSLGRAGLMDELFTHAGFCDVATTRIDAPFRLPSVHAYLDFTRAAASPIVELLAGLDETRRAAAWAEIAERLGKFSTPTGWEGPNELLLTVGKRPS